MKSSQTLGVGEVAEQFGLATHVLRHWESMGLLKPRRDGDRRRYTDGDLDRIAVIVRAKEAGFGLDDIREMITAADPVQRKQIMHRHQADLAERIAALQASLALVDGALRCDHEDFTQCPNFLAEIGLTRSRRQR
nr:MerR family transcriptional regulator [Kibdelosporangium sp. MJ126-NF4]